MCALTPLATVTRLINPGWVDKLPATRDKNPGPGLFGVCRGLFYPVIEGF